MARRMGRLRTQTVSANVRQEEEIKLLKDFKARGNPGFLTDA